MADHTEEGFFARWSRIKAQQPSTPAPAPETALTPSPEATADAAPLPTLADAAALQPDADFSPFVGKGVDQAVRRLAMKKLFADPHFNVMDGLDIYMGDYNQPDPISETMMAALHHSKSFFAQIVQAAAEPAPPAPAQPAPPPQSEA